METMERSSGSGARVLVFAGSARADSLNRKLAQAAAGALEAAGLRVTFADLRDYSMPLYDGDLEEAQGLPEKAKAFKELVRDHDAFVIASPEHNGSFTALLKNVIDWASRPEPGEPHLAVFRGKTAALLSVSPGRGGGRRGLRHLRELLEMIGVTVIPAQFTVAGGEAALDPGGYPVRPEDAAALNQLVADLASALDGAALSAA